MFKDPASCGRDSPVSSKSFSEVRRDDAPTSVGAELIDRRLCDEAFKRYDVGGVRGVEPNGDAPLPRVVVGAAGGYSVAV